MVVLPLACRDCGKKMEIASNEPMPLCGDCGGKMRPAGPVQEGFSRNPSEAERLAQADDLALLEKAADGCIVPIKWVKSLSDLPPWLYSGPIDPDWFTSESIKPEDMDYNG